MIPLPPKMPKDRLDLSYNPNGPRNTLAGFILILMSILLGVFIEHYHIQKGIEILVFFSFVYFLLGIYVLIKGK